MVSITIIMDFEGPLVTLPTFFGLSIDEPLTSDFWISQPDKTLGSFFRVGHAERTFDLEAGTHTLYIASSAEPTTPWTVYFRIPNILSGDAKISAIDPFSVAFPVETRPIAISPELATEIERRGLAFPFEVVVTPTPTPPPVPPTPIIPVVSMPSLPWYVAWLEPVIKFIGLLTESVVNFFAPIFEPLKDIPKNLANLPNAIKDNVTKPLVDLGNAIGNIPEAITDSIVNSISKSMKSATEEGIKTSIETVTGIASGTPDWVKDLDTPLRSITDDLVTEYKAALNIKTYEKSPLSGEDAVNALEDMKNKLLITAMANFTMHAAIESGSLGQFEFMKDLDPLVISKFGMDSLIRTATMLPIEKGVLIPAEQEFNTRYTPEIPTYTDLINMVVKEVIPLDAFTVNMAKKGYNAMWSKYIWDAHFIPPSLGDILTAWRRKLIDEDRVDELMILVDLDPRFKDIFDTRKYIDPALSLARFGFETGSIDAVRVKQIVQRQGYLAEDVDWITDFIVKFQERRYRARYLMALQMGIVYGAYTDDELTKEVVNAGYSKDTAMWMIKTAEVRKKVMEARVTKPKLKLLSVPELKKAYYHDLITADQLRTELLTKGFDLGDVDILVQLIDHDKFFEKEGKEVVALSIGQLLNAYRWEEMTRDELVIKLQLRGLSPEETETLIKSKEKQWASTG